MLSPSRPVLKWLAGQGDPMGPPSIRPQSTEFHFIFKLKFQNSYIGPLWGPRYPKLPTPSGIGFPHPFPLRLPVILILFPITLASAVRSPSGREFFCIIGSRPMNAMEIDPTALSGHFSWWVICQKKFKILQRRPEQVTAAVRTRACFINIHI